MHRLEAMQRHRAGLRLFGVVALVVEHLRLHLTDVCVVFDDRIVFTDDQLSSEVGSREEPDSSDDH
jgi:hypothetical protein